MPQKLVLRADFARLTGKSRAGITKLCKGKLAPALVGELLNLDHPAARAYLDENRAERTEQPARPPTRAKPPAKKRPRAPTRRSKTKKSGSTDPTTPPSFPEPDERGFVFEFSELTHKQIVDRYGTIPMYCKILESHEKAERARKNWLDNEETEGKLIELDRVRTHVFGFIDASHKRILSDASKTMALRAVAMCKSGARAEELERFFRDTQGAILKTARDAAVRNLRRKKKPKKPSGEE